LYEEILMLHPLKYLWFLGSTKFLVWTVFITIGPAELRQLIIGLAELRTAGYIIFRVWGSWL
jgi:hypothetical protein